MKRQGQSPRQWGPPIGRWLTPISAGGTMVCMFLPWVRSGSARRSSFETWRTADRLGVLDGPILPLLAGIWVIVPVLAGLLATAALVGRLGTVRGLGLAIGGIVGAGALVVLSSPATADVGVRSAMLCSVATVAGAVLAGGWPRGTRERQDGRAEP